MKKRKKKIIKIVAGIVVVAIIAGVVIGSQNQGTAAIPVYTQQAFRGAISSELDTSGTVKAENTVTYFAPAGTKIAGVQVEAGDVVKSGDMMVCFDEAALAYAQRQSDLEQKISATDYTAAVQTNQE